MRPTPSAEPWAQPKCAYSLRTASEKPLASCGGRRPMADSSLPCVRPASADPYALTERWLHATMLALGFDEQFAMHHADSLKGTIRTRPEDLAKMEADLAAMGGS